MLLKQIIKYSSKLMVIENFNLVSDSNNCLKFKSVYLLIDYLSLFKSNK